MTGGIPSRPGHYDIMIITGDAWGKSVQLWAPGYAVLPDHLVPGDRIFYNGVPERIHSITPNPNNYYTIQLRDGFLGDPWFKIIGTQEIRSAMLEPIADAEAAWLMIINDDEIPQAKMIIPTTVVNDTVEITLTELETTAMEEWEGVWNWDLHCQIRGQWRAILEGTMIIQRSVAMISA